MVGLLAAVLIATLLTLSSVAKRTRELGTLKAVGWSQSRVVRQVTGESIGIDLKATVASASNGPGFGFGPFGQGAVNTPGSTVVKLGAPLSLGLILAAVALAMAGGVLAGAVGGLRAARLRPAEALRTIE